MNLAILKAIFESLASFDKDSAAYQNECKELLFQYFISAKQHLEQDDLLFLVRQPRSIDSPERDRLLIKRRSSNTCITETIEDLELNYYESLVLNIICQLKYEVKLTLASHSSRSKENKQNHIREWRKEAYAVPNKSYFGPSLNNLLFESRAFENKHEVAEISYPLIYFAFHDYEKALEELVISPGSALSLELLIAFDETTTISIFDGAVSYDSMFRVFQAKKNALVSPSTAPEFILMRGPNGKGIAQIAAYSEAYSRLMQAKLQPEEKEDPIDNLISTAMFHVKNFINPNRQSLDVLSPAQTMQYPLNLSLTYISLHKMYIIDDIMKFNKSKLSS